MHHIVTRSRRLADAGCASATCVTLTGHSDHDWQPGEDVHGHALIRLSSRIMLSLRGGYTVDTPEYFSVEMAMAGVISKLLMYKTAIE
jgi:hypothetical protein